MSQYLEQLFSLKGRTALVNGAITEFSQAVVCGLAQSGAIVWGVDNQFSAPKLVKTPQLSKSASNCPQRRFQFLCDRLSKQYGRFDLLINLEEINTPPRLPEITTSAIAKADNFCRAIQMQLARSNRAIEIAAPKIKQSGGGSILNIIKIDKPMDSRDDFSYVATRNALLMFTKELAVDLIQDNVRVNNIVIGCFPNLKNQDRPAFYHGDRYWQDVIATIVYLAGDRSSSITGQDLFINSNKKSE